MCNGQVGPVRCELWRIRSSTVGETLMVIFLLIEKEVKRKIVLCDPARQSKNRAYDQVRGSKTGAHRARCDDG